MAKNLDLTQFKEDVPLLIEAGFVAINQVDEDCAKKCFYAALVAEAEQTLSVIGLGIINLFKLELDEAKTLFNSVLEKEPDNEFAKSMLGIANLYTITDEGIKEGNKLVDQALSESSDPEVKQLCKFSLDLSKEIKKKMKDLHPLESSQKQPIHKRLKK